MTRCMCLGAAHAGVRRQVERKDGGLVGSALGERLPQLDSRGVGVPRDRGRRLLALVRPARPRRATEQVAAALSAGHSAW